MRNICFIIIFLLILSSCADNTIYFDKPQPDGIKNLEKIPSSFTGKYIDNDSNILLIDNYQIYKINKFTYSYNKTEIDTSKNLKIENGHLINTETNEKKVCKIDNNNVYIEEFQIDTIFNLSENNIIKKYKGNLILNYKSEDLWRVEIISQSKKYLNHTFICTKELFEKLSLISENEVVTDISNSDTLKMILKPTKNEFKEILDLKDSFVINKYREQK